MHVAGLSRSFAIGTGAANDSQASLPERRPAGYDIDLRPRRLIAPCGSTAAHCANGKQTAGQQDCYRRFRNLAGDHWRFAIDSQ
jgi:hypothetical protein